MIAVMAFGAMAGGAAAHVGEEHGTVTYHDSEEGPPTDDLQCEFWAKGQNMTYQNGTFQAVHGPGPSVEVERFGPFNGTPNGSDGFEFKAGPFTLNESDEYRISTESEEEQGEFDTPAHSTPLKFVDYQACPDEDRPDEPQPPACPSDLEAQAQENEHIELSWNASADADTYNIYRATEDGQMQHVAEVNDTAYTDTETTAETTYTYEVTAANDAGEAEDCGTAEVTAIPFFASPALVAMAAVGSIGAVAAVRTRSG